MYFKESLTDRKLLNSRVLFLVGITHKAYSRKFHQVSINRFNASPQALKDHSCWQNKRGPAIFLYNTHLPCPRGRAVSRSCDWSRLSGFSHQPETRPSSAWCPHEPSPAPECDIVKHKSHLCAKILIWRPFKDSKVIWCRRRGQRKA